MIWTHNTSLGESGQEEQSEKKAVMMEAREQKTCIAIQ